MKTRFAFSFALACSVATGLLRAETNEVAPGVLQIGQIEHSAVLESSGLIPSRRTQGFYWTHNDSGLDVLYGMTANGTAGGEYKLKDVEVEDWEDVASSGGKLYVADIGNNDRNRNQVHVYTVKEPRAQFSGDVAVSKHWELNYPDDPFDAESFIISRGYGFVISKDLNGGEASMYRFPLRRKGEVTLEEQCRLNVAAPPAGADLTSDNRRLAVITEAGAYLFLFNKRIPAEGRIEPTLFVPFAHAQMEGCSFTNDGLLVTSESREIYLFTDPMFRLRWRAPR